MPDESPKSRMISLRVSEEEYEALHSLYTAYGARSVSDFARLAMQHVIGFRIGAEAGPKVTLQQLDERLRAVERTLARLQRREKLTA